MHPSRHHVRGQRSVVAPSPAECSDISSGTCDWQCNGRRSARRCNLRQTLILMRGSIGAAPTARHTMCCDSPADRGALVSFPGRNDGGFLTGSCPTGHAMSAMEACREDWRRADQIPCPLGKCRNGAKNATLADVKSVLVPGCIVGRKEYRVACLPKIAPATPSKAKGLRARTRYRASVRVFRRFIAGYLPDNPQPEVITGADRPDLDAGPKPSIVQRPRPVSARYPYKG